MYTATMTFGFDGYKSESVESEQLGTNLLFHTDRTQHGSDFRKVISKTGIDFLRYPGGTISEEYFDLSNPNARTAENIIDILKGEATVRTKEVLPLDEFLNYAAERDARVSLVLPTYRFFDPLTGSLKEGAEQEIRAFINNLINESYGKNNKVVIEIGNEWYQHRFDWSIEQFGKIQSQIAAVIDDESRTLGRRHDVTILAQAGRSNEQNILLAEFFEDSRNEIIDGTLTHLYGTNASGDPMGIGYGIGKRLENINEVWGEVLGSNFELAVTEWNIGENGPEDTQINGLMRLAPLMRVYAEMLANDVDLSMIWSAQTYGPAGLSTREGSGSNLSPTGQFYSILSESIRSMRLIDTGSDEVLYNSKFERVGYSYVFENNSNYKIYAVSAANQNIELDFDLSSYFSSGSYIHARILTSAPGESGVGYWEKSSIRHVTNIDLSTEIEGEWAFTHELGPYEMLELNIVKDSGVQISGDAQIQIDDVIIGGDFDDRLSGSLGDDLIYGEKGEDHIDGGLGDDEIFGGHDHDTLIGGQGNDYLEGQHGRDVLFGGDGDDRLYGGYWHDILVGGLGFDTLVGEFGNDTLRMGDGGGTANGGPGVDTLSFEEASEEVRVWTEDSSVEVGLNVVEFSGIEIFYGSSYGDRFSVIVDETEFFGLAGSDTLNLLFGEDNFVDLGKGNDLSLIYGGKDNKIEGGSGNDRFLALGGSNELIGGFGSDEFVLVSSKSSNLFFDRGDGSDSVVGFSVGFDHIYLNGFEKFEVVLRDDVNGTHVDLGEKDSIFFRDVFISDIDDVFIFT